MRLPLARLNRRNLSQAGPKAISLGVMIRAGLPVPPGFVLAAAAFEQFVQSAPGWPLIRSELAQLDHTDAAELEPLSRWIQSALAQHSIPVAAEHAIRAGLEQYPAAHLWAVRSSATFEDLPGASFAGQYESFLNVPREEIPARVRECWLSLFSARALLYRLHNRVPLDQGAMAVIIQTMIPASVAGVLFTADPSSRDPDRIIIEGAAGLGDKLVAGRVAPDRVVLAKPTGEILERGPGGIVGDQLARRLAELSRRAEKVIPGPLDIEWAASGAEVCLLQARPITGLEPTRAWEDRQVWSNLNTGEVFPDVVTPSTWSMLQSFLDPLFRWLFRLHGADITGHPLAGCVAGRLYFNANTGLAALRPFWWLIAKIPNLAQAIGGGHLYVIRQGLFDIPAEDLPDLGFRWHKYVLSGPRLIRELIAHSPRKGDAWCARLKGQSDELARIDIEGMSTQALAQYFTRALRNEFEGWDLLYLITQAAALPVFQKACRDWLGDPDLTLGYRLFSALGVAEAEVGLALWRLAERAHADPQTEAVCRSGGPWSDVRARLVQTARGRDLVTAWDAFMAEHGHHCRGELELANPRWSETPDYILGLVRGYLPHIDQGSPVEKQQRLAREREELTSECRRRLKNPIKRWIFLRALSRAQKLAVTREEWKNQAVRRITVLRRILLALGQRLHQQGILSDRGDIFFLKAIEVEAVAAKLAGFPVKELLAARRHEYEENLALAPPGVVIGRFRPGAPNLPMPDGDAKLLEGIPVSPGTATGPAKVILRSDDHQQVLPGEILIAPFTDPAWTPYFLNAGGVIMDQGGILSHGSIIAREYGIPAITNAGSATRIIHTGDLVQLDGNRGRAMVLERARSQESAPPNRG